MSVMTDEQFTDWTEHGFVVVGGMLQEDDIQAVLSSVREHAKRIAPSIFTADDDQFHQGLINLRQDRAAFARLYDTLQSSGAMQGVLLSRRILQVAGALLGDRWETLSVSGMGIRLDPPRDSRNSLGWHQERSYYSQNEDGANGLVVWIPLQDVNETNGGVVVKTGSHREGFVKADSSGKADQTTSEQYHVPEHALARYPEQQVIARAGTGVFFNMNMMHASGQNKSKKIRMTLQARIHRAIATDFRPGRLTWIPS
jgi:ectoine hydroxylase-related dioxygenase (phytanoyl-CoA dioxygenase family)